MSSRSNNIRPQLRENGRTNADIAEDRPEEHTNVTMTEAVGSTDDLMLTQLAVTEKKREKPNNSRLTRIIENDDEGDNEGHGVLSDMSITPEDNDNDMKSIFKSRPDENKKESKNSLPNEKKEEPRSESKHHHTSSERHSHHSEHRHSSEHHHERDESRHEHDDDHHHNDHDDTRDRSEHRHSEHRHHDDSEDNHHHDRHSDTRSDNLSSDHRHEKKEEREEKKEPEPIDPAITKFQHKLTLLKKIKELMDKGIKFSQDYDMESNPNKMEYELAIMEDIYQKNISVKWYKGLMNLAVTGAEHLNHKYLDFKLDGWSKSVSESQNDGEYDSIYEEIHDKYKKLKSSIPPELRLAFFVGLSGFFVHMKNSNLTPISETIMKDPEKYNKLIAEHKAKMADRQVEIPVRTIPVRTPVPERVTEAIASVPPRPQLPQVQPAVTAFRPATLTSARVPVPVRVAVSSTHVRPAEISQPSVITRSNPNEHAIDENDDISSDDIVNRSPPRSATPVPSKIPQTAVPAIPRTPVMPVRSTGLPVMQTNIRSMVPPVPTRPVGFPGQAVTRTTPSNRQDTPVMPQPARTTGRVAGTTVPVPGRTIGVATPIPGRIAGAIAPAPGRVAGTTVPVPGRVAGTTVPVPGRIAGAIAPAPKATPRMGAPGATTTETENSVYHLTSSVEVAPRARFDESKRSETVLSDHQTSVQQTPARRFTPVIPRENKHNSPAMPKPEKKDEKKADAKLSSSQKRFLDNESESSESPKKDSKKQDLLETLKTDSDNSSQHSRTTLRSKKDKSGNLKAIFIPTPSANKKKHGRK